jgi:hypothetical protein
VPRRDQKSVGIHAGRMAGLSLECGDCKTQLRSVEEAQEHAELTGHTNFQESTEPVGSLCLRF